MLYLLDANVLIDANRDYYPLDRVPQFWEWLAEMGRLGRVKVPLEIYEEVVLPKPQRPDLLVDWLTKYKETLVLPCQVVPNLVATVTDLSYARDLTDDEVEKIGRDPFLVAYAVGRTSERCIVTTEHSRPSRKRANRKLPDVCDDFSVRCIDTFRMTRELNFRTT